MSGTRPPGAFRIAAPAPSSAPSSTKNKKKKAKAKSKKQLQLQAQEPTSDQLSATRQYDDDLGDDLDDDDLPPLENVDRHHHHHPAQQQHAHQHPDAGLNPRDAHAVRNQGHHNAHIANAATAYAAYGQPHPGATPSDLLSTASDLYRQIEAAASLASSHPSFAAAAFPPPPGSNHHRHHHDATTNPNGQNNQLNAIPTDDAYWTSLPQHLRQFIRSALPNGQPLPNGSLPPNVNGTLAALSAVNTGVNGQSLPPLTHEQLSSAVQQLAQVVNSNWGQLGLGPMPAVGVGGGAGNGQNGIGQNGNRGATTTTTTTANGATISLGAFPVSMPTREQMEHALGQLGNLGQLGAFGADVLNNPVAQQPQPHPTHPHHHPQQQLQQLQQAQAQQQQHHHHHHHDDPPHLDETEDEDFGPGAGDPNGAMTPSSKKKKKKKKKKTGVAAADTADATGGDVDELVRRATDVVDHAEEYRLAAAHYPDYQVPNMPPLPALRGTIAPKPAPPAAVNPGRTTAPLANLNNSNKQAQFPAGTTPSIAPQAGPSSERERIRDFWLGLKENERRALVKVEKEAVLRKMKEQQRTGCSCAVCGRKRSAIEDELEQLYDAYYDELESYALHQQRYQTSAPGTISPPPGPGPFPGSVDVAASTPAVPAQVARRTGAIVKPTRDHKNVRPAAKKKPSPMTAPNATNPQHHNNYHDGPAHGEPGHTHSPSCPHHPHNHHGQTNPTTPATAQAKAKGAAVEHDHHEEEGGDEEDEEDEEEYDEDEYDDEEEDEEYDGDDDLPRDDLPKKVNKKNPDADFFGFGSSLTVKGGILTVADDLLKNDGHKFLEMMEQLADKRIQHERDATMLINDDDDHPSDEEEDDDDDDEDDEEDDEGDDEDDDEVMTEAERMEEGRRMFQIFAARMFEQRVLTAYREKLADERQNQLLREFEAEQRQAEEAQARKAKENQKKKDKKKDQKQKKEEERLRKEAEREAAEKAARETEEARLEEERRRSEEARQKREEERRKKDEERLKREERARQLKEEERRLREEKARLVKEARLAADRAVKENKAREAAEKKEREEKEEKARLDREAKEAEVERERQRVAQEAKAARAKQAQQQRQATAPAAAAAQAAVASRSKSPNATRASSGSPSKAPNGPGARKALSSSAPTQQHSMRSSNAAPGQMPTQRQPSISSMPPSLQEHLQQQHQQPQQGPLTLSQQQPTPLQQQIPHQQQQQQQQLQQPQQAIPPFGQRLLATVPQRLPNGISPAPGTSRLFSPTPIGPSPQLFGGLHGQQQQPTMVGGGFMSPPPQQHPNLLVSPAALGRNAAIGPAPLPAGGSNLPSIVIPSTRPNGMPSLSQPAPIAPPSLPNATSPHPLHVGPIGGVIGRPGSSVSSQRSLSPPPRVFGSSALLEYDEIVVPPPRGASNVQPPPGPPGSAVPGAEWSSPFSTGIWGAPAMPTPMITPDRHSIVRDRARLTYFRLFEKYGNAVIPINEIHREVVAGWPDSGSIDVPELIESMAVEGNIVNGGGTFLMDLQNGEPCAQYVV